MDASPPVPPEPYPHDHHAASALGEAMAIGACSAALITACNAVIPVVGGIVGGGVAAGATYEYARRKARPAVRALHAHVDEAVDAALLARSLAGGRPPELDAARAWEEWIPWDDLRAGERACAPAELPHPTAAGFKKTRLASGVGQVADWVHPLSDGSRLHAHEFADGRVVVHRDRLDPGRGPVAACAHWFSECPEGRALGVGLLAGLGVIFVYAVATTPLPA